MTTYACGIVCKSICEEQHALVSTEIDRVKNGGRRGKVHCKRLQLRTGRGVLYDPPVGMCDVDVSLRVERERKAPEVQRSDARCHVFIHLSREPEVDLARHQ